MKKRYRPNVAIVIVNEDGKSLVCERSDVPGAWQLPQGGIEAGEAPREALARELQEETGAINFTLLDELPETIRYPWPERLFERGYHGQEQYYFLIKISDESELEHGIKQSDEFSCFRWQYYLDFLAEVSGFKAEAYREALQRFAERKPTPISNKREVNE